MAQLKAEGETMSAEEQKTWKRRQQIDYLNGEMDRINESIKEQKKVRARAPRLHRPPSR